MSATGGKITLRFEVDIAQLEQKIAKVQQNLDKVQTSGDKVNQSLEKTSQASVTSAVRFQTLSQGAINLTTSFAQTYTSLSNIQRAQTTVAAATVSLERAEDLLQRKTVQLNEERRKAVPNMDKIRLLTNEISTAERDLGVKRQKLTDATNQANDTNILFAINLLNVSFAAIQTGKSMIDMAKATTVASVGVGGVTKAVGVLRGALTFLQAHPVFAVITLGLIAWELGFSKLIKQINGVDLSIQGLTEKAFGLDQMKDATEILGTEFENTGSQIESMGGTMTSVSGSMIGSLGNVQTASMQLKGSFVNISTALQEIASVAAGVGGNMSVLDYIKRTNSEISSVVSDLNMLTERGLDMESAKKLILDDILQDEVEINKALVEQLKAGTLTVDNYKKQLDILEKIFEEKKNIIRAAEDQIKREKELGRVLDDNQKKTTNFDKLLELTAGASVVFNKNDPLIRHLRDTSKFDPVQLEVFKRTGINIGRVAEAMPLKEAERIARLEKQLGGYANGFGGGAGGLAITLGLAGGGLSKSSFSHFAKLGMNPSQVGNALLSSGTVSATQAYQIGRNARGESLVAVPAWVKEQIREQDAWRNSVEGQLSMLANALLTGGTFAFSSKVAKSLARSGGGLSMYQSNVLRAAGLLGVSVPYEGFKTTANEVFTGAAAGLSLIVKENGVREEFLFAAMDALAKTVLQVYPTPYGWSSIRMGGAPYARERRQYQAQGLQNYVSRVAQGNFGIYDATVLNAMTGAYVSEYTSEISDFNSKIAPILNIAHSDFKTTLVDPKRGINEVDDRIRWTQRLEQISTGATVF